MLTPGAGRITLADKANRGVFFRLATPDPVRVWTGRPPIRLEANDLDPTPQIYTGVGSVAGLPELDRLINGEARRVDIVLSGLTKNVVDIIDSEFADLGAEGIQARFGHRRYDRLWRPTSAVRWIWDGILDEVVLEVTPEEGGQLWSVTLSMSTAQVDRRRAALKFWTPQRATAGDRGFDNIPGYTEGTTRIWPPG